MLDETASNHYSIGGHHDFDIINGNNTAGNRCQDKNSDDNNDDDDGDGAIARLFSLGGLKWRKSSSEFQQQQQQSSSSGGSAGHAVSMAVGSPYSHFVPLTVSVTQVAI